MLDGLTERALSTFGPADRADVIRALREIQRNLSASWRPARLTGAGERPA